MIAFLAEFIATLGAERLLDEVNALLRILVLMTAAALFGSLAGVLTHG